MSEITKYLNQHRFTDLFIEILGWDRASGHVSFAVDGRSVRLSVISQKRGLQVLHVTTNHLTLIDRGLLRRMQRTVSKLIHEHVLICSCEVPRKQVWLWAVRREDGRRLRHREHPFFSDSPPPRLLNRLELLRFTLDEEEDITLIDAFRRVRDVLDTKAELNLFANKPWYAARSDELARAMQAGGDDELSAFLQFHRPLVTWAVRPLLHLYHGCQEDAEQSGMIGLLHAARRFQPDRGFQFSSYATRCIQGYCKQDAPLWFSPIRVPTNAFWPCSKLKRKLQRVLAGGGPQAVAAYLRRLRQHDANLTEAWNRVQIVENVRSLSHPSEPEYWQARRLIDPNGFLTDDLARRELAAAVDDAVSQLRPRDAAFVRLKYGFAGDELTLEEIGRQHGVSRERVRQRLLRVLPKLERILAGLGVRATEDRRTEEELEENGSIADAPSHFQFDVETSVPCANGT